MSHTQQPPRLQLPLLMHQVMLARATTTKIMGHQQQPPGSEGIDPARIARLKRGLHSMSGTELDAAITWARSELTGSNPSSPPSPPDSTAAVDACKAAQQEQAASAAERMIEQGESKTLKKAADEESDAESESEDD